MQPPFRRVSDTENKLRLLYCLEALGGSTQAQLWPFVEQLELMDYITMQLLLHELKASGDVQEGRAALAQHLFLDAKGRETLRLFAGRIMQSDKQAIQKEAPAYRERVLQHSQVQAIYERARRRDYHVLLSITEGEVSTLQLRMHTPDKRLAAGAIRAFPKRAADVLTYLYAMEVPEKDNLLLKCEQGEAPSIHRYSLHEFTVSARLPFTGGLFVLELLLPGKQQASYYQRMLSDMQLAAACGERLAELLG